MYGCSIMMLTFVMALVCIEQYSRYDNALNTQMAADALADGTAVLLSVEGGDYDDAMEKSDDIKKYFLDKLDFKTKEVKIDKARLEQDKEVSVTLKTEYNNITNIDSVFDYITSESSYEISREAVTSYKVSSYMGGNYRANINEQAKREIENAGTERQILVEFALSKVGGLYSYGGTDFETGVDCSGFTMLCYEHLGYSIPRTAAQQMQALKSISRTELRPGDLLFYKDRSGNIGHVTMYIGGNQVVHASNSTDGIIISDIGYRQPAGYGRVAGFDEDP